MNSVLLQELARFNSLIEVIKDSLNTLQKTLQGRLVTSTETEELQQSIVNNSIPERWRGRSYPSRKPLMSYVADLKTRLEMLETWIAKGQPNVFWISGFFFTHSFLTGVKQNFARKHGYPIDRVGFAYTVLHEAEYDMAHAAAPELGAYVHGLYLEGATWDDENGVLRESDPKVIYTPVPVIHFTPVYEAPDAANQTGSASASTSRQEVSSISQIDAAGKAEAKPSKPPVQLYACPAYKTSARAGVLLTTGHSTNFIQLIDLPTFETPSHWVKRSVALLSQLDQ